MQKDLTVGVLALATTGSVLALAGPAEATSSGDSYPVIERATAYGRPSRPPGRHLGTVRVLREREGRSNHACRHRAAGDRHQVHRELEELGAEDVVSPSPSGRLS